LSVRAHDGDRWAPLVEQEREPRARLPGATAVLDPLRLSAVGIGAFFIGFAYKMWKDW
jgi:hypothetical protein